MDETGTPPAVADLAVKLGITPRQAKVLRFIKTYYSDTEGVPPTYQEISAACGFTKSGVHAVVTALVERGHLTKLDGRTRSLAVVE